MDDADAPVGFFHTARHCVMRCCHRQNYHGDGAQGTVPNFWVWGRY